MRNIKFKLLTQQQVETLTTDARTFGQMVEAINASDFAGKINLKGVKFIERETKVEYGSINDALLPVGDCLFFVTPVKTKSGANVLPWEDVDNMSYQELRTYGASLNTENNAGIALTGKRTDILNAFRVYYDNLPKEEEVLDYKTLLNQAIVIIQKAITLGQTFKEAEPIEFAVDGVTFEELANEAEALKKLLNK